jgi:lipoprotein-releasing system permease protein
VAIIGVTFGVSAFLVVITVLNSFQNEMKQIISSITPNLTIFSQTGIQHPEQFEHELSVKFGADLVKQSKFIFQESILSFKQQTSAVDIRAIDGKNSPSAEQLSLLISPKNAFSTINTSTLKDSIPIILGKELAENLGVKVGDFVTLMNFAGADLEVKYLKLYVSGIIHVGISQYDKQYALMNFYDAQKLFGTKDWASGIEIKLKNPDKALAIAEKLNEELPYTAVPWQSIDKDLFNQIERDGTFIKLIVLIISLVAGFNIIVTLSLTVIDRSKQIALLRSLGARKSHVIGIFVFAGTILGCIGSLCGIFIGYSLLKIFAGLNIGDFQNFYYLEKIPVQMDFQLIVIAFSTAVLLSFVGALFPAWKATQVSPLLGLKQ